MFSEKVILFDVVFLYNCRTAQDDKNRRIRAFLSCMRSENPLMTNTSYVPQHLLLLATVLR